MSSSSATIATAVQGRGFDRWLIPPAALAVHLSIGQLYAFSVFNEPLTRAIGITASAPGDWRLTDLGWIFSLAIVTLGLTAAFAGKWLERVGPRKALLTAAACFGGGFVLSAIGVHTHQIALIYLGYGVIGGFGLGLGYVTPVTVLIKWFPDRRGLAAGLAIMGFGGGALIGAPLAVALIGTFKSDVSVGVAETFHGDGARLRHRDRRRRARHSPAGARLEARRLGRPARALSAGRRFPARGAADQGVLAALACPVPERDRRHRRARAGVGADPGSVRAPGRPRGGGRLRRAPQPLQHGRAALLVGGVRPHRAAAHLLPPARARVRALRVRTVRRSDRRRGPVRRVLRADHQHVRRRLRRLSRVRRGPLRHAPLRHDLRAAADRVGDRGRARTRADQLRPRASDHPGRAGGLRLRRHDVHPRRGAGARLPLQRADQATGACQ